MAAVATTILTTLVMFFLEMLDFIYKGARGTGFADLNLGAADVAKD